MRSLFVFPALDRAEAVRRLELAGVRTDLPLGVSESDQTVLMWAEVFEDLPARDFTAEDVAEVERVAGFLPARGIELAISGHFPDSRERELREVTTRLLSNGGCATSIDVGEFRTSSQWHQFWAADDRSRRPGELPGGSPLRHPSAVATVVRADQGRTVPWRNGLGTTRELARVPDSDDWHWRLSIATSTGPTEFSSFPGVDRELLLLEGEALELRFAGGRTVRLGVGERLRFRGEEGVVGAPVGGATRQVNLMWRRDLFAEVARVEVIDGGAHVRVDLLPSRR